MKGQTAPNFPAGSFVPKAVANLKTVTVAAETSTPKELEKTEKAEELNIIGLFDWAIDGIGCQSNQSKNGYHPTRLRAHRSHY